MKTLKRLSGKAIDFCDLSGFNADKVKDAMKCSQFAFQKCETKVEMDDNGVDYKYPYVIVNPFNINLK